MLKAVQDVSRYAVVLAMLALPIVLLISSVRTFRELDETKRAHLRSRAATIAVRLENLEPGQLGGDIMDLLSVEEPALAELRIYDSPGREPDDPILTSIRSGQTLYHTEEVSVDEEEFFRAYIPFHTAQGLSIARIDLAAEAADYLVVNTRRNVLLSFIASLVLVLFTIYFIWSERRAMQLQRRHLELEHLARLGKMSAVLAHEIRNPLGAIKGFVQLALEKADQSVDALLSPVLTETNRLEKLVGDLLMYGRPRKPETRQVAWQQLGSRLDTHAAEAIGERRIQFVRAGSLAHLETDPDMLVQVLLNLIRNSVEALGDAARGEVRLTAARLSDGELSISVEDNGPGVAEDAQGKLFEPFFTTKSNGTGLGLPIARKLTAALGGRLEIRPLAPQGTRAELIFP